METNSPAIETVARVFGLKLVVRFGSMATGRARPGSDQDIAVLPERRLGLDRQADLVAALQDSLGGPEVDLTVLDGDDGLLLFRVAREGSVLYEETPTTFLQFRSYAARRYDDTERYRAATARWLEARLG
ncbi:MAG: nucleotidyltransferase domain-containing protein [Deltaproteobacteria bacterium]|nr:nucleotidyltransferase domain-containing protein [Deltaproteobacteria bacterium]